MLHIRGEGQLVRSGFNFYPWRERKSSVGFLFKLGRFYWQLRWSPRIKRLFNYTEWAE